VESKLDTHFAGYVAFESEEQARIVVSNLIRPDTIGRYWKLNEEIDIYGKKENKVFVGEVK
jgi:hypothetical protein